MPTLTATYVGDLGRVRLEAGDLDPNVVYSIQRQTAIEPTWVDVRGAQEITAEGTTIVNDYEYTPNVVNTYRLTGPIFYDSFARVYPAPIEEGFETLPLDLTITQGTSPGPRLNLAGGANDYATTPDNAALDITGDIDLRIDMASSISMDSSFAAVGKWGSSGAGTRSYILAVSNGSIEFSFSSLGTNATTFTALSTATLSTVLTYVRQRIKLRATRVAATGVVTFYYSTGDISAGPWTQLGSTVVLSAGTAIFSGSGTLRVGADTSLARPSLVGSVYRAQVYNGIAGTLVANPDFSAQPVGTTPFADSAGRNWTYSGTAAIIDSVASSAAWARTTAQAHTGSWSLGAGAITDVQVSDAVVTVPVDASSLRFWYKVSSESGFDYLYVFVDGTLVLSATGEVDWTQSAIFDVSSATNVTFRYLKDGNTGEGSDTAWIDDVVFDVTALTGSTWGTADTGQVYTTSDIDPNATLYVNNGVGVVADPDPVSDVAELYAETDGVTTDAEVTFSAIQPAATVDATVEYNLGLRATPDHLNYYEGQLFFRADGDASIRIAKTVGGVYSQLTATSVVGSWEPNVAWHARLEVVGSTLQLRAWADGTTEPTGWQLTATDTDLTTGTGIHVRARKPSGVAYEQWFGPIEVNSIPLLAQATAAVTPVQDEVFLKSVQYPSLNQQLECVDWDAQTRRSRAGFFDVKGRHEILAITDVGSSATFNLTFITRSRAANRGIVALLTYGGVMLLQPPGDTDDDCQFGTFSGIPGGYVMHSNSVQAHSVHGQPIWQWTVTFTQVAEPDADVVGTTITWDQLWDIIGPDGTWEDVWATWPTWQALWNTTGSTESFF